MRDRQRLQAFAEWRVDVAWIAQAKQAGRRLVEPEDALAVALDHDHGIGQRSGCGAIGAQHVEQAPFARTHLALTAMQ